MPSPCSALVFLFGVVILLTTYFYPSRKAEYNVYVGSFTGDTITIFTQHDDGRLAQKGAAVVGRTPTWMEFNHDRLFTTVEASALVASYHVNRLDGSLSFISNVSALGINPTYLTVDRTGRFVLTANYVTGDVFVFAISANGTIGKNVSFGQHTGSGPDPDRQRDPHPHQIILDTTNQFVFSADLGADKVYQYKFDAVTGALTPNTVPFFRSNPGDGPRHLAFHPSYRFAYLICELSSMVITFRYDSITGLLTAIQRIPTLPTPVLANWPGEILVIPNGRFLYLTNRGNNSDTIGVYVIDQQTGLLEHIQNQPVGGLFPRGLVFDQRVGLLNQNSGTVTIHEVNAETGLLTLRGVVASGLVSPACMVITEVIME